MNHVTEIVKRLERATAAGAYLRQVFEDWLALTHATLAALPAHLTSAAATGQLAVDTPETQALFARLRARYPQPWTWQTFTEAFTILLNSTEGFWTADAEPAAAYGWDVLGAVYMLTAYNQHSGQYFTPWNVAELMAHMTIPDGAAQIHDRLRQAQARATARADANAHLLAATLLTGLAAPPDQTTNYFLGRVLPLIAADYDPVTLCDPCVGSGVMLLTAARRFPAWAVQANLVQFFGMDIDPTCVTMAQCNLMLYGLNGFSLQCARAAPSAPTDH